MREKRLACQYHWSLEARKKRYVCVSAIDEMTFRIEGFDDKADSSRTEDDMNVFGRRERSGASGRLKNDMKQKKSKK